MPIDVLTGDPAVRETIESGADLRGLQRAWRKEIVEFENESREFHLYA